MSDTDQMTDSGELRGLRDSLSSVPMPERPRLEAITARGRARRRHRLSTAAGLSVAGVAAGTALALGLTGALGPAPVHGTIRTLAPGTIRTLAPGTIRTLAPGTIRTLGPGTIRTAAFKIVKNPNGTARLTINPKELFDPATLQSDLAKYGIPAKVTSGSFCSSDPAPAGFPDVVSFPPREAPVTPQSGVQPTVTLDPAAMPAGTELSIGYFQLTRGEQQASFALIDTSSYSCTNTPPGPAGPPDGSQLLYGGPGPAGS
jgi:hypothetical protein